MPRGKTGTCVCEKCSKEISLFAINRHRRACNGPLEPSIKKKRVAWNKGLTIETDERVRRGAATCSRTQKGRVGRPATEETKRKLSEIRKAYLEKNPEKVPYRLNHSSKISYPEQYFIDCFKDIAENIEFQYQVSRYNLDFANPREMLYLEIDGEQHYVDKRIVDHDKKRTAFLEALGWKGIRVRWSHFKKMNDADKITIVDEIRSMMKWVS